MMITLVYRQAQPCLGTFSRPVSSITAHVRTQGKEIPQQTCDM